MNDETPPYIERVLAAVRRGEVDSFRLVVREYGMLVRGYLAARLPRQDDADDLAQEVFLIAFEKLGACDPAKFVPWLLGIARNQLRNHWRARARREDALSGFREEVCDLIESDAGAEAAAGGFTPAQIGRLLHGIAQLPERLRRIVRAGLDGVRSETLAAELGIKPNALYQARFRARAALRSCLTQGPGALAREVVRLIASPRTDEFVSGFVHQWLHPGRLDFFQFDTKQFRDFDESAKAAVRREVYETFAHLLRNGGSLSRLLKSDEVHVNGLLATYYGIEGVNGDGFRPVKVPEGSPRGGLLGMAAVLAMGGNGERTSPVERGAWVLRYLLHNPPPPAPPNVPQLDRLDGKPVSPRERLAAHMEEARCAQCHRKIDPIGFGLENFNAAGKWREVDYDPKTKKEWPIDLLRARDGRHVGLSEAMLATLAAEWSDQSESDPMHEALRHCLGKITPNNRELLRLRDFERRSCPEVAAIMGKKIETVYQALTRLHRAPGDCLRHRMTQEASS